MPRPCRRRCCCSRPRPISGAGARALCAWHSCCSWASACSTCSRGWTWRRRPSASPSLSSSGWDADRSASARIRSRCGPRSRGCRSSSAPACCSAASPSGLRRPRARVSAPWYARRSLPSLWQPGPLDFHDELGAVDEAVGLTGVLVLAASLWMVFRPLGPPAAFPDLRLRRAAAGLVRRHGTDTLAYFKLRRDQHYLFSADRRAFLGYRVETGVLLVSGDPVGPDEAIPGLLRELSLFAETRGLRIAALGAGERASAALGAARAARHVPGRRGRRRDRAVLARGPADPQGPRSPSRGSRSRATRAELQELGALVRRGASRSSRT